MPPQKPRVHVVSQAHSKRVGSKLLTIEFSHQIGEMESSSHIETISDATFPLPHCVHSSLSTYLIMLKCPESADKSIFCFSWPIQTLVTANSRPTIGGGHDIPPFPEDGASAFEGTLDVIGVVRRDIFQTAGEKDYARFRR